MSISGPRAENRTPSRAPLSPAAISASPSAFLIWFGSTSYRTVTAVSLPSGEIVPPLANGSSTSATPFSRLTLTSAP
jgi:hypothetical protein